MLTLLAVIANVTPSVSAQDGSSQETDTGFAQSMQLGKIRLDFGLENNGELGLVASGEDYGYLEQWSTSLQEAETAGWRSDVKFRRQAHYAFGLDSTLSTADDRNNDIQLHLKFSLGAVASSQPDDARGGGETARVVPVIDPDDPDMPSGGTDLPDGPVDGPGDLPYDLFSIMPFVDLQYRQSQVGDGTMKADVSQQVLGAGAELVILNKHWVGSGLINLYPRLLIGYYSVLADDADNPDAITIPEGLTADHLAARLHWQSRLPFNDLVGQTSLLLDIMIGYNQPVDTDGPDDGGWHRTLRLLAESERFPGGFSPAIVYRSGVDNGLEIDRRLLLAVGMELW